ncbi:MAG: hypothetical protein HC800_24955 [Phormidesmis sp. RL_2_1]|nr:hypothetical protein [Phormidesmis sp. RL_2_1]
MVLDNQLIGTITRTDIVHAEAEWLATEQS